MNRNVFLGGVVLGLMVAMLLSTLVFADGPDPGHFVPHGNHRQMFVETRVETRSDGVHVLISVRESIQGEKGSEPAPPSSDQPSAETPRPVLHASAPSQPVSSQPPERYWSDATGIYRETSDGHLVQLTPPPIGAASLDSWSSDLNQHPNDTPYLLYVDGKYQDVVWIPQSPQNGNIQLDASSSASSAQRNGRPTGDGNSTDPREVALSALGHVPLPNIQVRANPALGLVNLAGWFWVEGYDGRPFGIERHVTVPAEVGDDVPATDVPLDDPRRRPTHFTVEVKIWPSQYEWDFGDGQRLATHSLGKPHPAESDIQHTYEHSSLGLPNGFPVQLTVTFKAEYRVNGGAAEALPSFQQTYEYGYRVQEMQAILTHR